MNLVVKLKKKKKGEKTLAPASSNTHTTQEQNKWTKQRKENKVEGMSFPKKNPLPDSIIRITKG